MDDRLSGLQRPLNLQRRDAASLLDLASPPKRPRERTPLTIAA